MSAPMTFNFWRKEKGITSVSGKLYAKLGFDARQPEIDALKAELEQAKYKSDSTRSALNKLHHVMKDAGLHPGRTDDDLLSILDADLKASKLGLHHLKANNDELRANVAELEQDAARYRLMRNQVFDIRKVAFLCGDALDAAIDAALKGQS